MDASGPVPGAPPAPWPAPGPARRTGPPSRPRGAGSGLVVLLVVLVVALAGWSWHVTAPRLPLGTPAPAPLGTGGFVFSQVQPDGSGRPVTFDACEPVRYVVRSDGAPPSGTAALAAAVAEVSRATGLVFVDAGETDEAPTGQRRIGGGWPGGAADPVLVAWATAAEAPGLAGDVAGYAGPVLVGGPDGSAHYVTGEVVLDAEDLAHAPGDVVGETAVRQVLLHELGHLVGLGHVDDAAQVMYPLANEAVVFAAGDLRGLHALGRGECR